MVGDPAAVPTSKNPYLAALDEAILQATPVAAECATALKPALDAMRAHAWVGRKGQEFFTALLAAANDAEQQGQECLAALRAAAASAPQEVPTASLGGLRWQYR